MTPTHYFIRDIAVNPGVVLAPMEGVTDLNFRRLVRKVGNPGLTCTEFIPSEGLRQGRGKAWEMARFDSDEHPVSVQIYGKKPSSMAEAARIVQDMGADICDINMGCPSKKVCAHSGGSALMKSPDLALDIVRAVRAVLEIPLTVKMRSGVDAQHRNAAELAYACQEEGAEAVTIHWRTREDRYGGERQVDRIAAAVDALSVPVIGNGDIIDVPSARRMYRETGCAGVMVGRGAIRDPWLPQKIARDLRGEPRLQVSAIERRRLLLDYFEAVHESFRSERGALGRMKMMANHFTRELPHGDRLRNGIFRATTKQEAEDHVERYFSLLTAFEAGNPDAFERDGPGEQNPRQSA